ncbi:ABC transporter, ATP-binding protein, partial [Ostertagia ostertagi]
MGNGHSIAINTGATVAQAVSIPVTGLPAGFHQLYLRVKNTNGNWGHYQTRAFLVTNMGNANADITAIEYFFDTDPGNGRGHSISVSQSADVNEVIAIPVNGLATGFHQLYLRARNNMNIWGHYQTRSFVVTQINNSNRKIAGAEYFVDTDPGNGNGTAIAINPPGDSINQTMTLSIPSGLAEGNHQLYIRTKNEQGQWSLFQASTFIVKPPRPGSGFALQLDGNNDAIALGTHFNYQTFSVEMWLKPGATQSSNANIIDNNHTSSRSWRIQQVGANTNQYDLGGGFPTLAPFTLKADEWQHVVITASPTQKAVYVNGRLVSSDGAATITYDGTESLHLGRWAGGGYNWNGQMDEVRIWNTALTETEIRDRMCRKITSADALYNNLLSYYNFDEKTGDILADDIGGHAGTLMNGPAWVNSGAPIGNFSAHSYAGATATANLHNDIITCELTSNSTCVSPATATSNAITMTITTGLTAAVTITAVPGNTICAGTQVTYTAHPVNGGTAPVYQWYINDIATGGNAATYTSSTFNNGDKITCSMATNASCATPATVASVADTLHVNPVLTPSITVAANTSDTICAGTRVTFTASVTHEGPAPVYQWKKNNNIVGTNSSTYSDSLLNHNDQITCTLLSNALCANPATISSAAKIMSVRSTAAPSITIYSNTGTTICSGTPVTFTASIANGGDLPSYQWMKNNAATGTNSYQYTDNNLSDGDVITCQLTSSNTCAMPLTAISNASTMTVNAYQLPAISISSNRGNVICEGTEVTFMAHITNGGTSPTYQWKKNNIPFLANGLPIGNKVPVSGLGGSGATTTVVSDAYTVSADSCPVRITAIVDVNQSIAELIETNNTDTMQLAVDLLSGVGCNGLGSSCNPYVVVKNAVNHFTSVVRNNGTRDAGPVSVQFTVNGQQVGSDQIPGIQAQAGAGTGPFFVTFFVSLFVLVMQFFWLYMDELLGKGLGAWMILQLLFFMSSTMVPLALPLGILLASIMTFGNMGENYELVAIKSSGISLLRFMRPLLILILFISGGAFIFNNNIIPVANLKALSLLYNLRNSKPTLNIRAGMFNHDIPNYAIKIGEKDKDDRTIRNVIIYDQSSGMGNDNVVLAEKGEMISSTDKRYLIFRLQNGWRYQEGFNNNMVSRGMGADQMRMHFKQYDKVFDLSAFKMSNTSQDLFKGNYQMMNVQQLIANIDTIKQNQQHDIDISVRYITPYVQVINNTEESKEILKKILSGKDTVLTYQQSFLERVPDSLRNRVTDLTNSNLKNQASMIGYSKKRVTENEPARDFTRWMWILFWVVLILFSIVKTKIVHYSSLCYFPLTYLAAVQLYRLGNEEDTIKKSVKVLLLTIGSLLAIAITALPLVGMNKEKLIPYIADPFAVGNFQADVPWHWAESLWGFVYLAGIWICCLLMRRHFRKSMIALCLLQIMIIQAELGALFGDNKDLSPEVEQEFLKQVQAFHEQQQHAPLIKVKDYVQINDLPDAKDLPDEAITQAWANLEQQLLEKQLQIPADVFKPRKEKLFAQLGINEFLHKRIGQLSTGMKQKVSIARTMIHNPDVVIFDEPTSGLDVITANNIIELIRTCKAEGKTVIFSSHIMSEVDLLCDELAIINQGRIIYADTMEQFRQQSGNQSLTETFIQIVKNN